jgi:hypothetical protein
MLDVVPDPAPVTDKAEESPILVTSNVPAELGTMPTLNEAVTSNPPSLWGFAVLYQLPFSPAPKAFAQGEM